MANHFNNNKLIRHLKEHYETSGLVIIKKLAKKNSTKPSVSTAVLTVQSTFYRSGLKAKEFTTKVKRFALCLDVEDVKVCQLPHTVWYSQVGIFFRCCLS